MNWILYDGQWVLVDTTANDSMTYTLPRPISIPKEVWFPDDLYRRLKEAGDKTPDIED